MRLLLRYINMVILIFLLFPSQAQEKGLESITRHDLEMHMEFLASDELQGRSSGEAGLEVAARYLAVQAKRLGLKPLDRDRDYMQYYALYEKKYNRETSRIKIRRKGREPLINRAPFYIFPAPEGKHTVFEGEVVFAGYGIHDSKHQYNDFEHIEIRDKIVMIMSRAPMNEDGTETHFDHDKWIGMQNFQHKMQYIYNQQPMAVLQVFDPKSGFSSIEDFDPALANYLEKSIDLKSDEQEASTMLNRPRMLLIHKSLADDLLIGTGKALEELQQEIDRSVKPHSFLIEDCTLEIEINMKETEFEVPNIFGLIEGGDPKLKDEVLIYVAHYDHLGTNDSGGVYNGADDNASGTVALIEIAEAFLCEKGPTPRSIGFLWVSAEEIGLFGSRYFAEHPLVPSENTVAVINLDMVGRCKSEEDINTGRGDLTIVGRDSVKVIGGKQSAILMDINSKTLEEMGMYGNYSYNDPNHPERYFYRSDHINFAVKDIPVLFYSTGTHRDYHRLTDVEERIDYEKYVRMTRFSFKAGYNVASYPGSIEVDNPMSGW